jgi:hypothetical protein
VNDQIGSTQRRKSLLTKETMGIGDQPDDRCLTPIPI